MLTGEHQAWAVSESGNAVSHADGRTVTVDIVGSSGRRLFAQFYLPAGPPNAGVVVCSPLSSEATRNERREFLAGLEWARHGIATVRFHYRGWGHSEGDPRMAVFPWLVEDASIAADELEKVAGTDRLIFLGTRFGAMVAASASADRGSPPLVFWQPTLSTRDFYRDVFRARQMGNIARGLEVAGSSGAEQTLLEEGFIDVIGHRIHATMFASASDMTLVEKVGTGARDVHVVQMSSRPQTSSSYLEFMKQLEDRGCRVTSAVAPHDGSWWFGKTPGAEEAEGDATTEGPCDLTTPFLLRTISEHG